jgi:transcriptional regulator with XRE-family HTH domain
VTNERINIRLGDYLTHYRTLAGMTQGDLSAAAGVERTYIMSLEYGRLAVPGPKKFNALHRVLRFPGWEALEIIGYQTDATREDVDSRLLAVARALPEEKQQLLAEMGRLWLRADG